MFDDTTGFYSHATALAFSVLLACALAIGAGCGGDSSDGGFFSNAPEEGGPGTGSNDSNDGESNGSDDEDPLEGIYEVTEATEDTEGCDAADGGDSIDPDGSHVRLRYEVALGNRPAYHAYWCDSADEEDCESQGYLVFEDVEADSAEDEDDLPPPDERAEGELTRTTEYVDWDDDEFACYALLRTWSLTPGDDAITFEYREDAVRAHEIQSENECDERAHDNVDEDDFECAFSRHYEADKVSTSEE